MRRIFKPLNDWRKIAGEIGIIVVGVLIALGAQQLVDGFNRNLDVERQREALRAELADGRARWEDMAASDRCTISRLDELERWLATAPAGERLERGFAPMLWNMHSGVWDIAKTSSTADDIPLRERLVYASLYGAVDNWRVYLTEERNNAVMLDALVATADQPGNRGAAALRVAVARQHVQRRIRNYPFFFNRLDELGIVADASRLTIARNPTALCAPLRIRPPA